MASINDLVNEALLRWVALLELKLDKHGNVRRMAKDCPWDGFEVRRHTESLNVSRETDPTGLTTFMLLRGLTVEYLAEVKFSASDLILTPERIESRLAPMRALRDLLENPAVVELVDAFQRHLRSAALTLGLVSKKGLDALEKLLADKYSLAHIRRDALLSMKRLEAHQFTQGPKDPNPLKFNPTVFEFWNVNSLLLAMRAQKVPGISLCLIRDPVEALHSYFVFAIRNGGTMTILTDRSDDPHPAYKRMSRRPDRNLDKRAERNWFPYQLLDLKALTDSEGHVDRVVAAARTQIVPLNVEAVPLKPIADLGPEQLVWTALMFDLLRDRYWTQNLLLPELSYTGEMVVEPAALVGASGALVKDGLYKPLELPPLTAKDVSAEATASQWQRPSSGFNRWLIDRYGTRVPEAILNPVGESNKLLLEERTKDPSFLPVVVGTDFEERGELVPIRLETLDATGFGPKDRIVKDRAWVGRMNYVKAIQRLANDEYDRTRDEVMAWYRAAVEKNKEALVEAVVREELLLPTWLAAQFANDQRATSVTTTMNAVRTCLSREKDRRQLFYLPEITFSGGHTDRWTCLDYPQTPALFYGKITVTCPEAISIVCATPIEELPWPLQHWRTDDPYVGNSILDRLDPEDWQLYNPWRSNHRGGGGIRLDIGVALCKSAHNERRKALGLPRKDWAVVKP